MCIMSLLAGLPEEVRMSTGFLRQQYAVVAVSSLEQCWGNEDVDRVKKVLGVVQNDLLSGARGRNLPMYAVGASSGGSFVAHSSAGN